MSEDGKIKWHTATYTLAEPAAISEGLSSISVSCFLITNSLSGQLSAVLGGITVATANAVSSGNNLDDILAVARNFSHRDRKKCFPLPTSLYLLFELMLIFIRLRRYFGE